MYIVKAKDGRIGFLKSYEGLEIVVPKDDITSYMCSNRKDGFRKYKNGKWIYKKKYLFSKDIIAAYHFSSNHIADYPKAAKALFEEIKDGWKDNHWDGNLIKDKKKLIIIKKKKLKEELKHLCKQKIEIEKKLLNCRLK